MAPRPFALVGFVLLQAGCVLTRQDLAERRDTGEVQVALVKVTAGTFTMGSGAGDDDEPLHEVTLTWDYWLGRHEVTKGEYSFTAGHERNDAAAVPMATSWHEAATFANECSLRDGFALCYVCDSEVCDEDDSYSTPQACSGYRLPTEAEWEYAARAGESWTYAGSNDVDAVAWYIGNNPGTDPLPVETKAPNAWGLHDMSGNVYEWTADGYEQDISARTLDPWVSTSTGERKGRVVRSGSYTADAEHVRVANRFWVDPQGDGVPIYGLRLARTDL